MLGIHVRGDPWIYSGAEAGGRSADGSGSRHLPGVPGRAVSGRRELSARLARRCGSAWDSPTDPDYDRIRDTRLNPRGLSERQVQIVWVKVANAQPTSSLPAANADAYLLVTQMGDIARALKVRYPNVRQVSRTREPIWSPTARTRRRAASRRWDACCSTSSRVRLTRRAGSWPGGAADRRGASYGALGEGVTGLSRFQMVWLHFQDPSAERASTPIPFPLSSVADPPALGVVENLYVQVPTARSPCT